MVSPLTLYTLQTDRQIDRQTDTHTQTHSLTQTHTLYVYIIPNT